MSEKTFTHQELVEAARRWLCRECSVVITEMANAGGEEADAIGWCGTCSTLIECKTSMEDFKADHNKPFRRDPEMGLGLLRYYLTPQGLLKPAILPDSWGLMEWDGKKIKIILKPVVTEASRRAEVAILLSALRRTGTLAPSGVSAKCYTIQTKCRATIGIEDDTAISQASFIPPMTVCAGSNFD